MALAIAIPLNLMIYLVVVMLIDQAREAQRAALNYAARTVVAAIDAEIGKHISIAEALARSPRLLDGDFAEFATEARRSLPPHGRTWVVVANLDGQQVLNSHAAQDQPMPKRATTAIAGQRKALASKTPVVTNMFEGPIAKRFIATVELPIFKNEQPYLALALVMDLQPFQDLLSAQQLPQHWLAGIIDGAGSYIARVPDGDKLRGELASEGWRATRLQTGAFRFPSREGDDVVNYNAVSSLAPWTVGVAVRQAEVNARAWTTTRWPLVASGFLSILSLALTILLARRVSQPLSILSRSVALQKPIALPDGAPPEIAELGRALVTASLARRDNDLRQTLLLRLTSLLIEAPDKDELGRIVYETVGPPLGADVCLKYRLYKTATSLVLTYAHGVTADFVAQASPLSFGQAFCGSVVKDLQPLVADAARIAIDDRASLLRAGGIKAYCCHPLRSRDGRVMGTFALASTRKERFEPEDVSFFFAIANVLAQALERVDAESALRQAHDTFRLLVDRSPFCIYAVDADFRLIQVSIGAQKVFTNVSPLIGRDFGDVLRILWPEPFVGEALGHFKRTLATGEPYHSARTVERRADTGDTEAYDWKVERLVMPDGRFGVVCHFYDLSERQHHETEMAAANERQQILMRELAHRGKNLLTIVQALAKRTFGGNRGAKEAHEIFAGRLQALARSYGTLTGVLSDHTTLATIVRTEMEGFASQTKIGGPDIYLLSTTAQTVALIVHELATNAAKYGALSVRNGRVTISWKLEKDGADEWLTFDWQEHGGPPVARPRRSGFGTSLVVHVAGGQLGCKPQLSFDPAGLHYTFRSRLGEIEASSQPAG